MVEVASLQLYIVPFSSKQDSKKAQEPEFKSPKVAKLFDKWRGVWLMSMDRQRKLQDALDKLNEVSIQLCGHLNFQIKGNCNR